MGSAYSIFSMGMKRTLKTRIKAECQEVRSLYFWEFLLKSVPVPLEELLQDPEGFIHTTTPSVTESACCLTCNSLWASGKWCLLKT